MSLSPVYKRCIDGIVSISSGEGNRLSTSSGFFIDMHHIVTCAHCVISMTGKKNSVVKIFIDITGSSIMDADIIGVDGTADIAVLRIETPIIGVSPLRWCSQKPEIGDQAIAIGTPYGDTQSVSNAYIRDISFYGSNLLPTVLESILIDGSAIGGNSGGPLLNMRGEVIGVVSFGYNSVTGGTMNGAVPSWIASPIVSSIIDTKKNYTFGTLRCKVSPIYIDDAIFLGMTKVQGYMVLNTLSPVQGIRDGDIITHVHLDGTTYEIGQMNSQHCIFSLIHLNPGKNTTLSVRRGRESIRLTLCIPSTTSVHPQNGYL